MKPKIAGENKGMRRRFRRMLARVNGHWFGWRARSGRVIMQGQPRQGSCKYIPGEGAWMQDQRSK